MTSRRRATIAVFAVKAAASALVLAAGFRQISDDDYSRVVIAQMFAHAPKLDPSGTSWLPFPFWMTGLAMLPFGTSLSVARVMAVLLSAGATAGVFAALRRAGVGMAVAMVASLAAALSPWLVWTGAAPVPEGFSGALVAIATLSLFPSEGEKAEPAMAPIPWWGAAAAAAAALSRYEAWPAVATIGVCAAIHALRALRAREPVRPSAFLFAGLALAAPLAWMAWNGFAHGDALHFLARVTRYRHSVGADTATTGEKFAVYPIAILRGFPDVLSALAIAAVTLAIHVRDRSVRPRLVLPWVVMLATLAFLIIGELNEGAPTHHPERALTVVAWLGWSAAALGTQAVIAGANETRRRATRTAFFVAAVLLGPLVLLPRLLRHYPGQGDADRKEQIAMGQALRGSDEPLRIVPCAYEHFAVLAAMAAPWRARVLPAVPRGPTGTCPKVEADR